MTLRKRTICQTLSDIGVTPASALEGFAPTPDMPEIAEAEAMMERVA